MLAPNAWDEDKGTLKRWVRKEKMKQRVLLEGSSVLEAYGGSGVPTVFWIDKNGIIVDAAGQALGASALNKKTKKLLASG